jgi:hypothetical protein
MATGTGREPTPEVGEQPEVRFARIRKVARPFYNLATWAITFFPSPRGLATVVVIMLVGAGLTTWGFIDGWIPLKYSGLYQADAEIILAAGAIYVVAVEVIGRRKRLPDDLKREFRSE